MPTPTQAQAREHQRRLTLIAGAAALAVRDLLARRVPLAEVGQRIAAYQIAAATASTRTVARWANIEAPVTRPRAFAGVSSYGFPVLEPLIATIDKRVPAPVEAIPEPWWEPEQFNEFVREAEQFIASEVADTFRTASQVEVVAGEEWQNYVRMLQLPSCKRCAVLAGRIYRDLDGFDRHPGCDCVHIPVQDWAEAEERGLVGSFADAVEDNDVLGLSKADRRAILYGADPVTVVNATRGTSQPGITNALTTEVFGRRVKATTYGTTKRAKWRRDNPTRLVRLRPESIFANARDHDDAMRLLRLYGYLT